MTATVHQVAQATCRLGMAAYRFTRRSGPCGSAAPRTWWLTRMSVIPGTEYRGGATGQVQNAIFAALVASTSAERSRGKAGRLPRYSQPSTSGVTMKCSRP